MKRFYLTLIAAIVALSGFSQTIISAGTGNWDTPGTWVGGVVPTNANCTLVVIANNHLVTVRDPETAVSVTINNQANSRIIITSVGRLTISGNLTLGTSTNRGRIEIGGILQFDDGATVTNGATARLVVQNGGTYRLNYTTGGFIYDADFQTGSTIEFTGYSNSSAVPPTLVPATKTFYNFVWNCPSQGTDIDLDGIISIISGDFTVESTSPDIWYLILSDGADRSLTVTGDMFINNESVVYISGPGGGADVDLTVGGDVNIDLSSTDYPFVISGSSGTGTLRTMGDLNVNSSTAIIYITESTGPGNIIAEGDINVTAGQLSKSGAGIATISFDGDVSHVYNYTGAAITEAINFVVTADDTLTLGTSVLTGTGAFSLNGDGVLQVGSTNSSGAIQTGTSAGNIRVSGTRTYSDHSTIVYNAAGNQFIGNGHPAVTALVNTVANNGNGNTLTLAANASIGGDLTISSGDINVSTRTLTLNGNLTPNGRTIIVGSSSNLVINGSGTIGTFPFPSGAQTFTALTLNHSTGVTFANDVTLTGTLTLTSGTISFPGRILNLNGTFAAAGSGDLSPSSTSTLAIGGSGAFGLLRINATNNSIGTFTFSRSSGTASINSTLLVTTAFNLSNGDFTNSGGLQMLNGSTLTRNSLAQLLGNAPTDLSAGQFYNVAYTGSTLTTGFELSNVTADMLGTLTINGGTVTLDKNIIVHNNVNVQSSSFDANGHDITLSSTSGSWNKTAGTFIGGSGTVTVDNSLHNASYSITASSSANFTNITVASGGTNALTLPPNIINIGGNIVNNGSITASAGTAVFNGTTTISGSNAISLNNVTISSSLTAPSANSLNIAGNFTNNGTFSHNNGSVLFNGTTSLSGSGSLSFFNVSIGASSTLTAPPGTMNVAGNMANSGTFNNNSGTIAFNGTVVAQSITGSAMTFNNMNVSNPVSPGVSVNSTIRLNGTLTLSASALFDADGSGSGIFILSSTSQTVGGRIAALPTPANFSGAVTIERYIHGQSGGDYRYLSIPITNGNVSMWKNSIFVTGNFSDRSTHADNANITDSGNMNPSISTYNSSTQAYVGVSGGGGTTAATALNSRLGYAAYDFNNGSVTASYRGTVEKGSVPITVSSTLNNFNLIPNPYPSAIDWDNVTKTNVNNAMYLRVANNVFSSYVGGVATNPPFVGWTGEVAIGQSFFTTSSGGGTTLTLNEADKTSNAFYFLRAQTPENYFRIELSSSSGISDESVIHFVNGATDGIDSDFDAIKLKNGSLEPPASKAVPFLNLSTYLDSPMTDYAINSMAELKGPKIVNLNLSDTDPGSYSLRFTDLALMSLGYRIVLVDKFLNAETEIKDNTLYSFTVTQDSKSTGASRFHLRINGTGVITGLEPSPFLDLSIFPNPVINKIFIQLTPEQEAGLKLVELHDILGNTLLSSRSEAQLLEPGVKSIDMSGYAGGVYVINIQVGDVVKATRIIKK